MSHPVEVRKRFQDLRAQGWSFSRIEAELNIPKRTLIRWQAQYRYLIWRQEYFDYQDICDRNHLSKRAQVEKLAVMIDRIDTNLAHRDLNKDSIKDQLNLRNELTGRLSALTGEYQLYMGSDPKPDRESYRAGLIGVH